MPTVVTQPDIIEESDFVTGGLVAVPDSGNDNWPGHPENSATNVLIEALNVLPATDDSGAMRVRSGFDRVLEELTGDSGRYIITLEKFRGNGVSYLIAVTTTGAAAANNVKVYAIELDTFTAARIDDTGVTWANPKEPHVLLAVDEKLYGASKGNDWYSWDPATSTWDATAAEGNWDTLVDSLSPGAGEVARDFAFKGSEKVIYDGDVFTPAKGIRFKEWENDQEYVKGERVSLKIAVGGETYWRSYRCLDGHTAVTADNRPGDGTDWRDFWQKVRLPLPRNTDDETSDKWYFVPVPNGSDVAAWFADRMWVRGDGVAGKDRLLYSAPLKLEKGVDITDTTFNMKDFAPGNDERGPGGGWVPFNDGRSGGIIEALHPYGSELLVFKRQAVWKLTGRSEASFTPVRIAKGVGAVGPSAVAEVDGLVYFLSDDGLYVTDGSTVEPVINGSRMARMLEFRNDLMRATAAATGIYPTLTAFRDQVYISMCVPGGTTPRVTYVYDTRYQSFWQTDLPIIAATVQRNKGVPVMYFSAYDAYGEDIVYQLTGIRDDTGAATRTRVYPAWTVRTAWWSFGLLREQRRIRRTWLRTQGDGTMSLSVYRDWDDSKVSTKSSLTSDYNATKFVEGLWVPDCHAISFKLSKTATDAGGDHFIYGVGVETQPRRKRYHV